MLANLVKSNKALVKFVIEFKEKFDKFKLNHKELMEDVTSPQK